MYLAIAIIVFFAGFAMSVREGLWNNLLNAIAIVIAGITAFGLFQPLTIWVDEQSGGGLTYLLDVLVLWGVFALVVGLLKALMQFLSAKRVRFKEPFDTYGGVAIGLVSAYVLCCFTMAAFHTAPLSRDMFGGRYDMGDTRQAVESAIGQETGLTRPDLVWLGFIESVTAPAALGGQQFSPSTYVHTYAEHRGAFEQTKTWLADR